MIEIKSSSIFEKEKQFNENCIIDVTTARTSSTLIFQTEAVSSEK
jgi:hypothetical protein